MSTIIPLPTLLDDALTANIVKVEKLASDARWLLAEFRSRRSSGADLAPWRDLALRQLAGKETEMSATAAAIEEAFATILPGLAPATPTVPSANTARGLQIVADTPAEDASPS